MPTSGTANFNLNARSLITASLGKLHVYAPEDTPSAADMEVGRSELNMLLKGLQRPAPSLFRRASGSITLVANTTAYTLTPRPFRVISARYRSADGRDLPMEEWTAEEYDNMPVKTSTGTPTAFFVDYQRDSVIMNIWQPLASVTGQTIRYTYQRRFEDVATLDEDIDIPQEHADFLVHSLADRLAPPFGKSGSTIHQDIKSEAFRLRQEVLNAEREGYVRFSPSY